MNELHVRWPAERFYWAVLDGSPLPGASWLAGRRRLKQLGYLFENVIPGVAIEEIQAVYRQLPSSGRRYLACGVPRERLREELDAQAVTLAPESMPSFIEEPLDPAELNLLTGPFLPQAIRTARRRLLPAAALLLAACSALLTLGLERRVRATEAEAQAVLAAWAAILQEVLGAGALQAGSQPPQLRLTAELRQLEQTRRDDPVANDIVDCAVVLGRLLSLWPSDLSTRTESIAVAPESLSLRATVANMADAQRLADALRPLSGWQLEQPQSEAQRDAVIVGLRFQPEGGRQ